MLRPFITDTLSKIGAINSALVEQRIRDKERQANESYQGLIAAMDSKDWAKAHAWIEQLQEEIQVFDDPEALAGQPIPYPETVAQVDDGIRLTLFELLAKPPVSVADFSPLQKDLLSKESVVATLIPENLISIQNQYESAVLQIQYKNWDEAAKLLQQLQMPPDLRRDAQEKLAIINKLRAS